MSLKVCHEAAQQFATTPKAELLNQSCLWSLLWIHKEGNGGVILKALEHRAKVGADVSRYGEQIAEALVNIQKKESKVAAAKAAWDVLNGISEDTRSLGIWNTAKEKELKVAFHTWIVSFCKDNLLKLWAEVAE